MGTDWRTDIPRAATYITLGGLLIMISCAALGKVIKKNNFRPKSPRPSIILWPLIVLGSSACFFVILTANSRGGAFLIAYQFSDLLVPIAVYMFSLSDENPRWKKASLIVSLLFFAYCVFVGFRYKIILLLLPLTLVWLSNVAPRKRIPYAATASGLLLGGLAMMTLTRSKFNGLNFDNLAGATGYSVLYGIFAETNLIFGLCSVLNNYLDKGITVGLTPFTDSFLELIPKFLYPDRVTGERIYVVLAGLGGEEAYNSATTYPFVGEMLMMGGIPGLILGCLSVALLIMIIHWLIRQIASTQSLLLGGYGIISATFGYYFVSRGYLPQFSKALIFVVLPYMALLVTSKRIKFLR